MKTTLRIRADNAKKYRCKNLIVVLENPKTIENVGSTIRNVDALGAQKLYVIDGFKLLPDNWQVMRNKTNLNKISVSAIKWAYVRRFPNTESCIQYLKNKGFVSVVTSPHQKGKTNVLLENGSFIHKKLAVWFGNESQGISDEAVSASEFCVNITMSGIIESLNLGTCTGIVLYEVTKQRRKFVANKKKIECNKQMIKLIRYDKNKFRKILS
jgi:tRNA (guanosine-2'-O-)-methyltransferase